MTIKAYRFRTGKGGHSLSRSLDQLLWKRAESEIVSLVLLLAAHENQQGTTNYYSSVTRAYTHAFDNGDAARS